MAYTLLIEDDTDLREEIREYLQRRRHKVRDVAKIGEAREAILEQVPDVVISDINLPDGNGGMFCVEHAPQYPRTKWLLMSGDPNSAHYGQQLKRDPDDASFSVLIKPVPMRILEDFVRQISV